MMDSFESMFCFSIIIKRNKLVFFKFNFDIICCPINIVLSTFSYFFLFMKISKRTVFWLLDKIKTKSLIACSNSCFEDQDQLLERFFKIWTPLPIAILLIMRLLKKMPKKIEINYLPSIERSFSHVRFSFRNDLSLCCG